MLTLGHSAQNPLKVLALTPNTPTLSFLPLSGGFLLRVSLPDARQSMVSAAAECHPAGKQAHLPGGEPALRLCTDALNQVRTLREPQCK